VKDVLPRTTRSIVWSEYRLPPCLWPLCETIFDRAGSNDDPATLIEDPTGSNKNPAGLIEDPTGSNEDPAGLIEDPTGSNQDPGAIAFPLWITIPVRISGKNLIKTLEKIFLW